MGSRRRHNKSIGKSLITTITDLTHDGRGVGRYEGKVVFVRGALPDEEVEARITGKRRSYMQAIVTRVLKPSVHRVVPNCQYFGVCGGCSFQHLEINQQREFKQDRLLRDLSHIGKVTPAKLLPPLVANQWAYRRKARLGLRLVPKKGGILIGFREAGSSYITSLDNCAVLTEAISALLIPLHRLLEKLSIPDRIPQIEVAEGDDRLVLIFRNLDPFTDHDRAELIQFSTEHSITVCEQPGGLDSVAPLIDGQSRKLCYRLDQHNIDIFFNPTDFIQVNNEVNQLLINRVLELLALGKDDHVLDLFCGVGNFSLPLARYAGKVTGVEGDALLVGQARENAVHNKLINLEFYTIDLQQKTLQGEWVNQNYTKMLIDPPRSGASDIINQMDRFNVDQLIYVSCNPETLARDTALLIQEKKFSLDAAGIIDMFPHTAHVESIAVFTKRK